MSEEELKPCPFCESVSNLRFGEYAGYEDGDEWWARVECECGIELLANGESENTAIANVITFWNRRILRDRKGLRDAILNVIWNRSSGFPNFAEVNEATDVILAEVEKRL